jgi:hypothetical protein
MVEAIASILVLMFSRILSLEAIFFVGIEPLSPRVKIGKGGLE